MITNQGNPLALPSNGPLPSQDNPMSFWREFVGAFFHPSARQRWCVASYGCAARHPAGVFPQVRPCRHPAGVFPQVRPRVVGWHDMT